MRYVLLLVLPIVCGSAQSRFSVVDLGRLPGGFDTSAVAVNRMGHVVGSAADANARYVAFLYTGSLRSLGTLGGPRSKANSINSADQIVGSSETPSGVTHAFFYDGAATDAVIVDLHDRLQFGGNFSSATGINDAGQIVGSATTSAGNRHAFLLAGGTVLDLHSRVSLGGPNSIAFAISDTGRIVGVADEANGDARAFLYDLNTSQLTNLGTLGGVYSVAAAVNSTGVVVGASDTSADADSLHAFRTNGGTGMTADSNLGGLGGSYSNALGINAIGHIVGEAEDAASGGHAFLYTSAAGIEDLENLIPPNSGWLLTSARAINESGQIVGVGVYQGRSSAFLLTPTTPMDSTPPLISHSVSPPPVDGWNKSDVLVKWTLSDPESGVASSSGCGDTNLNTETAGVTLTCSAANHGGLSASDSVTVRIDRTLPVVTLVTPSGGESYILGASVIASYGCSDPLSGVASCQGPVPNGSRLDTGAVGPSQSFTVVSTDVAGNSQTASASFQVVYAFSGFLSPAQSPPAVNTLRAGQSIPIRWRLQDAGGNFISDLRTFSSLTSIAVPCAGSFSPAPGEPALSSGASTLRYDSIANQYVYNWQTLSSWTGCRALQLTLKDGSTHVALFSFR